MTISTQYVWTVWYGKKLMADTFTNSAQNKSVFHIAISLQTVNTRSSERDPLWCGKGALNVHGPHKMILEKIVYKLNNLSDFF